MRSVAKLRITTMASDRRAEGSSARKTLPTTQEHLSEDCSQFSLMLIRGRSESNGSGCSRVVYSAKFCLEWCCRGSRPSKESLPENLTVHLDVLRTRSSSHASLHLTPANNPMAHGMISRTSRVLSPKAGRSHTLANRRGVEIGLGCDI